MTLAAACERPHPKDAAPPAARVAAPAPGRTLSESYPAPASPAEPVRAAVFDRINADRAAASLSPVAWDEPAARVADAFCAAQVAEKTRGHFLRDGVPPYGRTALAGVFGFQAENSASWLTTATTFENTPLSLALSAHRSMMEEKPPDDGHRRTILDSEATHVGVGWAMSGGRFQMAQEFLARGLENLLIRSDDRGAAVRLRGEARAPYRLRFVTVAREPLPRPLGREEASARTTYSYPEPAEAFVEEGLQMRVSGAVTKDRLRLGRGPDFSLDYAPDEPGLYTFVFWLIKSGEDRVKPLGSAMIRVEP